MSTRYKDVVNFPGYRVGTDGSVWSCKNKRGELTGDWRRLAGRHDKVSGYVYVNLQNRGKNRNVAVHTLVLETFVGPKPYGCHARHFPDREKTNNNLNNLSWATPKVNINDQLIHGTRILGDAHWWSKLKDEWIPIIVRLSMKGVPQTIISEAFMVDQSAISALLLGKVKKHFHRPPQTEDTDED